MRFRDFLKPEGIRVKMKATDKKEVITKLVDLLAGLYKQVNRDEILNSVLERESLMSTGVGKGVAIPHGKADSVTDVIGTLAILEPGVEFGSPDGVPVEIVILLVASTKETGPHIRALAHISRVLQDEKIREALLKANSTKDILEVFDAKEKDL